MSPPSPGGGAGPRYRTSLYPFPRAHVCCPGPPVPRPPGARAVTGATLRSKWLLRRLRKRMRAQPLLSFDYMSLGLGESRLYFKLTHFPPLIFRNLYWALTLSSAFPTSSGAPHPHPTQSFSEIFPGWIPPLMVAIWLLLLMPRSSAPSFGFYWACTYLPPPHLGLYCTWAPRRNFPVTLYPSAW